jgi:tetratricopeptide (TPR) repeat protein
MVWMRVLIPRGFLALVVLIIPVIYSCATSSVGLNNPPQDVPVTLLTARDAWLLKDYEAMITTLESAGEYSDRSYLAEKNYLLGIACFEKSSKELSQLSMHERMFQSSNIEAYYTLDEALARFQDAIWYDTDGSFTTGSFYMSGRILDVGFLQRMDEAMEFYRRAFTLQPESSLGQKALQRYRILAERTAIGGH